MIGNTHYLVRCCFLAERCFYCGNWGLWNCAGSKVVEVRIG